MLIVEFQQSQSVGGGTSSVNEQVPVTVSKSEREARSEFVCGLTEKSEYARPNPTRPDPVTLLKSLPISLERVDRFTSGLLCSMSSFNKFRI